MSWADVSARIFISSDFDGTSVSAASIMNMIGSLYNRSTIFADRLEQFSSPININFEQGELRAPNPGSGNLLLDPNRPNNDWRYVSDFGRAESLTFEIILLHELNHAITGLRDNTSATDLVGDNVRSVNPVLEQLGYARWSSYVGTDPDRDVVQLGRDYTEGNYVDLVIVDRLAAYNLQDGTPFDPSIIDRRLFPSTNDLLIGQILKSETYYGGTGNDWLYGDGIIIRELQSNDTLFGNEGNDYLNGGGGQDLLRGGSGDDRLVGSFGNDLINGGDIGIDSSADGLDSAEYDLAIPITISIGGTALDTTFSQEADFDRAIFVDAGENTGTDTLISIERISGTDGDDLLLLNSLSAPLLADRDSGQGGLVMISLGGGGGDFVDMGQLSEGVRVEWTSGDLNIAAINDADRKLVLQDAENFLFSEYNDDIDMSGAPAGLGIDAGGGDDIVRGGTGDDYMDGGAGADILIGGNGVDQISGGSDADFIRSDWQDTWIFGGDGHDAIVIEGSPSQAGFTAQGGAGNDYVIVGANISLDYQFNTGDGHDHIILEDGATLGMLRVDSSQSEWNVEFYVDSVEYGGPVHESAYDWYEATGSLVLINSGDSDSITISNFTIDIHTERTFTDFDNIAMDDVWGYLVNISGYFDQAPHSAMQGERRPWHPSWETSGGEFELFAGSVENAYATALDDFNAARSGGPSIPSELWLT